MSSSSDPAARLGDLFPAVARAFANWADSQIEETGMSPARVRLLGALLCGGPQTMGALGERLGVTPRNITALVDGLEGEGSVRRVPHPTDRRVTMVELTPAGQRAVKRLLEPFHQTVSGMFGELPETDRHELVRLLEAVAAILRRRTPAAGNG
jgi:DNA-binding MarR family transcriptional regulator